MNLSTETSSIFIDYCLSKTEKLNGVYQEFYDYAISDLNSSKMREEITLKVCAYDQVPGKLGYDGVNDGKLKEVKPKLFTGKSSAGNGNFSDLTLLNLEKKKEDNIDVIVSYFYEGRLVYIIEFPFNVIYNRLYEQVQYNCVVKGNKFCRSANFSYKDYMQSPELKIVYLNWDIVDKYPKIINRNFLKRLKEKREHANTITKFLEC
jgi:hypothetical protein